MFHGEVCHAAVSKDGEGAAGEVEDGSQGSVEDNGTGHDIDPLGTIQLELQP